MRLGFSSSQGRLTCTVVESTLSHKYEMPLEVDEVARLAREMVHSLARGIRVRKLGREMADDLRHTGEELWRRLVPGPVRDQLRRTDGGSLLLDLDEALVAAPWELLFDGEAFLCRKFAVGRTVATQQPRRRVLPRTVARPVKVLVVAADPQGDLEELDDECRGILEAMDDRTARTRLLRNAQVTVVRRCLKDYDVVHFAGHADYLTEDPEASGWRLVDGKLTARDVVALGDGRPMPVLVFSNGCRSASTDAWDPATPERIYGLANAFLLAGVKYYLGTQWDVVDRHGAAFATAVYQELAAGRSLGRAVRAARLAVVESAGEEDVSWAAYVLYGDPNFTLLGEYADTTPHPDGGRPAAGRRAPTPVGFADVAVRGAAAARTDEAGDAASTEPLRRRSIAVLPARNGGDPEDAYLAAAFTDDLIDLLATGHKLHVVSRAASARAVLTSGGDPVATAASLRVDALVEAEVARRGDRIQVTARLIDGATARQLLTLRRDTRLHESLALDDELAVAIAGKLEVELGLPSRQAPADDAAIDRYLRARSVMKTYAVPDLLRAASDFESVVAGAPGFASALAGAAQARLRLWMARGDDLDRLRAAAATKRALAIEPDNDEARLAAAWLAFEEGSQVAGATRAMAEVARRAPTNALVQLNLAWIATELGELDRAFRALERAELIEPGAFSNVWVRAWAMARKGDLEQALADLATARQLNARHPCPYILALRFAAWAHDDATLHAQIASPSEDPVPALCTRLVLLFDGEDLDPTAAADVTGAIDRIPSLRVRNLVRGLAAELAAWRGHDAIARAQIELAVEDGSFDADWIERTRLFDRLRASGALDGALARAREQARAVRGALGY